MATRQPHKLETIGSIPISATNSYFMIAIGIGHSRTGDTGATSVGGVSEWHYNSEVAALLQEILEDRGIKAGIFDSYPARTYGKAMLWLAERIKERKDLLAIELHFNSSSSPASHGHEFLYWHSSPNGKRAATCFAEAYKKCFPSSTARRDQGRFPIASRSERGGEFLARTHCPAIICEPFFGSNPKEWRIAANAPYKVALAYADAIETYLKRQ